MRADTETRYWLREARERDLDFMFEVKRSGMRPYVEATWGRWDEVEQRARFVANFTPAYDRVIVTAAGDVGSLCVSWDEEPAFLAALYLAASARGAGLGTAILRDLQAEARRRGRALELRVLLTNLPARRLYDRLGFVAVATTETHTRMRYEPPRGAPRPS
ncbi:MAG: GNAT family N-acetyltransferase [Nannocystaceae bacterium]